MGENKAENKMLIFLKKKINKMSPQELDEYLSKLGLTLPKEGLTEEFVEEIYAHIRSSVSVTRPVAQRFKEFGYGLRDLRVKNHHWVDDLKSSKFKITRPIIICLPGNGAITSEKANGFCKVIESALGLHHETDPGVSSYDFIDVLGVHYGTNKEDDTAGTINEKESEEFVERLFMPLCVDDRGKALTLKEVCTNMSLITFASHCYGAIALDIIMNTFSSKLSALGFKPEEIMTIKSHMCQITYSPYTDNAPVPTIRIDSMTDSFHRGLAEKYEEIYGHKLDGVELQYDKAGMFRKAKSNNSNSFEILHILSSRLLNREDNRDLSKLTDEHTIEYLAREVNWVITNKAKKAKNANLVSLLMAYAVSWAVSRSYTAHSTQTPQQKTDLNGELREALESIMEMYSEDELKM